MINTREFRVVGMSRSGTHAIINWMRRQAQGNVCFVNCAEPGTNPFWTARPMDHGLPYEVNYETFCWEDECQGRFSRKDYLIFSHEDVYLGRVCAGVFEEQHDQMVGVSGQRVNVLIVRDPFNLFASRMRLGLTVGRLAVRIWKQHAREFLKKRRNLSSPTVYVNYNRWFQSGAYRRQLADHLGLCFTDAGIQEIPRCAGGSSFDGRRLHGRAQRMGVLSRWREFAKDDDYLRLFDPELVQLSDEVFGRAGFSGAIACFPGGQRHAIPRKRTGGSRRVAGGRQTRSAIAMEI